MNRVLFFGLIFLFTSVAFISCSKEYSVESGVPAKGSLHDVGGNCYTSTVSGTYAKGIATNDKNYVDLQVNVTTAGNYSISTSTTNGFSFSDAGSFTSTGVQTVRLKAAGKPTLVETTLFSVTFDTTTCSFSVNVVDSAKVVPNVNDADSAWSFKEGTKFFHGYIDTAFSFDTTAFGQQFKVVFIQGLTAATGDSVFLLSVAFPGGSIQPGTYTTTTTGLFQFLGSYNAIDTLYSATPEIPSVITTITISSYNSSTKVISGSFSGQAKNKSGATVLVSAGKFTAKLD